MLVHPPPPVSAETNVIESFDRHLYVGRSHGFLRYWRFLTGDFRAAMTKLLVKDTDQGRAVPFLRGILTRSLLRTGLSFEEAYRLAAETRDDLLAAQEDSDDESAEAIVSSEELRDRVLIRLESGFGRQVAERYRVSPLGYEDVRVHHEDSSISQFSRARLGSCLRICGLDGDEAAQVTIRVYQHLLDRGRTDITSVHLRDLIWRVLRRELGDRIAARYRMWLDYQNSGRTLLILLGGTAACGKSTLANELANLLGIVRTQSTDMLREVMRMMVPPRLMPTLHNSSYNAWRALPGHRDETEASDELLFDGYRAQAAHVEVACEAIVNRAVNERVSLILEGVHVHPVLADKMNVGDDTVVVPVMLGVLRPDDLEARIQGRGRTVPGRRAKRYLDNFDSVWRLQSYLLSEADRAGIPIVANTNVQFAVSQILELILDKIETRGAGT